jgi:hypothetical protein
MRFWMLDRRPPGSLAGMPEDWQAVPQPEPERGCAAVRLPHMVIKGVARGQRQLIAEAVERAD